MDNRENTVDKNQEVEIKLNLDDGITFSDIEDILSCHHHEIWQTIHMEAHYLDTVDHDLQKMQFAYRLRRENENIVATIKAGTVNEDGVAHRYEVNENVSSMEPDLSVFYQDEKFGSLLKSLGSKEIIPLLKMDFIRMASVFDYESSKIEIAVDRGFIQKGEKTAPIWELELELKEGLVDDLLKLKQALIDFFQINIAHASKLERGLAL